VAEASAVSKLVQALRALLDVLPNDHTFAVVGGLAVSARSVVFGLQGAGFTVVATIEHATMHRLATVRLRQHPRAPFVDLLFASCGVEPEIANAASPLELLGVTVPVAMVGHLIAMKLVSRDPKRRPRDQQGFRVDGILSPGSPRSAPSQANEPAIALRLAR
jgi:hypothetical protein